MPSGRFGTACRARSREHVRFHAHRLGRAGDDAHRLVDVAGVQVGHLRLGDLAHLVAAEAPDLLAVRLAGALLDAQRLLDQDGRRRRLGDEGERAVLEDRDLDRRDAPVLGLRLGVERLAELHDVHAVLAERGTDRRRRVRLSARDLELDQCENFLGHQSSFFTWSNVSSTGTCRSKMSTSTFSFCWSPFTSTTSPSKSESGPDVTLTDSPSENSTCARGRSPVAAAPVLRMRSTSPCGIGTGLPPGPAKPVTPGVFFTTVQASSFRSMFTST